MSSMSAKTYEISTEGSNSNAEKLAEEIQDLAHIIRAHPNEWTRVANAATSIMYLAADIRRNAEVAEADDKAR
jgi:hypothetical protein